MSLYIIIGVIALAAIALLSFKVFKSVLKAVFSVLGSILLIIIILGVIIYMDVQKANTLFEEGNKVFLYEHNDSCLVGVRFSGTEISFSGDSTFPEGVQAINNATCAEILTNAKNNDLNNSILFVINEEVLEPVEEVDLLGYQMEKESVEDILLSDTPKKELVNIVLEQEEVPEALVELAEDEINQGLELINRTELKASVFLILVNEVLKDSGEQYLLEQMKEKNIDIYPQFLIIKGIQFIPDKLFDKTLQKIGNMKTEVNEKNNTHE